MNLNETEKDLLVFIYNLVKDPNPEFICLNLEGMVFYENVEYKILYNNALKTLIKLDYVYDNFDSEGEFFMSDNGKIEAIKLGERSHIGITYDENRKLSIEDKKILKSIFKEHYEHFIHHELNTEPLDLKFEWPPIR